MKLTNLILTGMVALALGACSSSDNDSSATTEKNAALSFSFSLPSSSTRSRATAEGEAYEQKVNKIDVRIDYGSTFDNYSFSNISQAFTATPNANAGTVTYSLNAAYYMQVSPGTATVYVTVNGADDLAVNTNPTTVLSAKGTSPLDYLTGNNGDIAVSNAFVMSGHTSGFSIVAGTTPNITTGVNVVSVNVYRVAAKLQELSTATPATDAITHVTDYMADNTGATNATIATSDATALSIHLLKYSYLNLSTKTNLFHSTTVTLPSTNNYLQGHDFSKDNSLAWSSLATKDIANSNTNVTYCMENTSDHPTYVIYQAQIYAGTSPVETNCYTVKNGDGTYTLYKTWADLETAYNGRYAKLTEKGKTSLLTDNSSYEDFLQYGVQKYEGGKCYYKKEINTGTAAQFNTSTGNVIVRNNWYELTVTSVTGLGSPVPDPNVPTNPTLLALSVVVNPWVVQVNGINF